VADHTEGRLSDQERRLQVGAKRREATRAKLLCAATQLLARDDFRALTIDDFIHAAAISRATFYNHFQTREELIEALVDHIRTQLSSAIETIYFGIGDPVRRIAAGVRLFIRMAHADPSWGRLILRVDSADKILRHNLRQYPLADIKAGMDSGKLKLTNAEAGCDLVLGASLSAMTAAVLGEMTADYGEEVCFLILRGLGVNEDEAARAASAPLPDVSFG
jgi:AcrR family transcriptional regulator